MSVTSKITSAGAAATAATLSLVATVPTAAAISRRVSPVVPVNNEVPGDGVSAQATKLEGASPFAKPPAGFDPLRASNAELAKFGYPIRPPGTTPGWWLDFVQDRNREYDAGKILPGVRKGLPPLTSATHSSLGGGDVSTLLPPAPSSIAEPTQSVAAAWTPPDPEPSQNWTGFETVQNPNYDITQAQAYWTIPSVSQYPGDVGNSDLSVWPGIGSGASVNDPLVQLGSASDVNGSSHNTYCWSEIFPLEDAVTMQHTCKPGDIIHAMVQILPAVPGQGQHAFFEIKNDTQNWDEFRAAFFTNPYGSQIEWIAERDTETSGLSNLPNFAGFTVHGATGQDSGLHSKNVSDPYSHKYYMTTACTGELIGHTSSPSASTNAFSVFRDGNPSGPGSCG